MAEEMTLPRRVTCAREAPGPGRGGGAGGSIGSGLQAGGPGR